MHPGEIRQEIGFVIAIAKTDAGILSVCRIVLNVVGKRIVWDLVVILARRGHETQLIGRVDIEDKRPKAAVAIGGVVHYLRHWRLQAEIAAVSVPARVVGKALGGAAEAELVVGLIEISHAQNEFSLPIPFETRAWNDVENSIRAVTEFRAIAPAADFEVVDIFGIELRSEVGCDIGVGDGNTVNEPTGLVSTANVKLVVCDVGSGHEVRDHG